MRKEKSLSNQELLNLEKSIQRLKQEKSNERLSKAKIVGTFACFNLLNYDSYNLFGIHI